MADATFDNVVTGGLRIQGERLDIRGFDGAGNHWIRIGDAPEPDSPALGFNLSQKAIVVNAARGWTLTATGLAARGARTNILGFDGAGNHWLLIGDLPEPQSAALGFNPAARTILIGTGWTTQLGAGLRFPDGSVQNTAQLQGPPGARGPQGPQGAQGPAGAGLNPRVVAGQTADGAGQLRTFGPAGGTTAFLGENALAPNAGILGVTDLAGNLAGLHKAAMYVDANGNGIITAALKNFHLEHPTQPDADIVYACIEGPEAAAYVRGASQLVNGRCVVDLPDHFTHVVSDVGLTVHVTPSSAESLGLAVTAKSNKRIVVEELRSGNGSYSFDWTVTGVRAGHEGYRAIRPRGERRLMNVRADA